MLIGFAMIAVGYAIFYWGLHHMPQFGNSRLSLWTLFGFGIINSKGAKIPGDLSPNIYLPAGNPLKFKA